MVRGVRLPAGCPAAGRLPGLSTCSDAGLVDLYGIPVQRREDVRIIMFGAAIVLALIFLPGLLHSGTGGAKDAGSKAGSSIVDNVKDPQAVVDGAGTVVTPVKEAVQPWYEWFFAQPWAYAAIGAGIVA